MHITKFSFIQLDELRQRGVNRIVKASRATGFIRTDKEERTFELGEKNVLTVRVKQEQQGTVRDIWDIFHNHVWLNFSLFREQFLTRMDTFICALLLGHTVLSH